MLIAPIAEFATMRQAYVPVSKAAGVLHANMWQMLETAVQDLLPLKTEHILPTYKEIKN